MKSKVDFGDIKSERKIIRNIAEHFAGCANCYISLLPTSNRAIIYQSRKDERYLPLQKLKSERKWRWNNAKYSSQRAKVFVRSLPYSSLDIGNKMLECSPWYAILENDDKTILYEYFIIKRWAVRNFSHISYEWPYFACLRRSEVKFSRVPLWPLYF